MLCVSIPYHGFFHTHPNDINVAKQGEKRVLPLAFLLLTPTQIEQKTRGIRLTVPRRFHHLRHYRTRPYIVACRP